MITTTMHDTAAGVSQDVKQCSRRPRWLSTGSQVAWFAQTLICVYIYIYTHREREIHQLAKCVHIYIYIYI